MADIKKTIEVIIGAVNKVSPGAREASADIEKLSSQATASGAALATFAAGGAAALFTIAKAAADAGDHLRDLSIQSGVAVEDLSTLKVVAEQNGTGIDSLAAGLKFLSRNAAEAAGGSGAAADAFKRLGVDVKDADGNLKPVKQLLFEAADGLAGVKNEAERTALQLAIFGRGGIELTEVLKLGSKGMREGQEAARALGLEISTNAAAAADNFNDSLNLLKNSLGGATNALGQQLLPLLEPMVKATTEIVRGVTDWIKANPGLASTLLAVVGVIGGAGGLLLLLGALTGAFVAVVPAATAAWAAITGPLGIVVGMTVAIGGLIAAIATATQKYKDARNEMNKGGGVSQPTGVFIGSPGSSSSGTEPGFKENPYFHGATPAPTVPETPKPRGEGDFKLTNAQALAAQFAGTRGDRSGNRAGGPASGPGFTPEDNSPVDPGLTFQLSSVEEFATKAGEALGNLPSLAGLAVQGMQSLGAVFGSITGGLAALGEAAKRWAIQMIQSILSVIAQGLILRLVLSFIPGLGPILNAGGGGGGIGPLGLFGGGGRTVGGGLVPRSAFAGAGGGTVVNLHVGALMGTRGEAVELGRMIARHADEARTGVRG